jgi:hypothetical protein
LRKFPVFQQLYIIFRPVCFLVDYRISVGLLYMAGLSSNLGSAVGTPEEALYRAEAMRRLRVALDEYYIYIKILYVCSVNVKININ